MHMRGFVVVLLFCTGLSCLAQEVSMDSVFVGDSVVVEDTLQAVLLTDVMENATVHQDSMVRQLMIDKQLGIQRGKVEVDGFRVQVYSSNQQQIAKNESLILQQELEKVLSKTVYTISEPPFWKVRVGDFLTREDAMLYKNELVAQFPDLQSSAYVVPDKVIIVN